MTHTNVIFFSFLQRSQYLNRYISIFFSCIVFGPGHPSPGLGCSACRFCTKKKKKRHTYIHKNASSPGAEGRGPGTVPQAGSGGAGRRLGRVHSSVSSHPQSPSCNVLLFVMVEQLCVNISKSLKKPETQLHPVLVISPPCGSCPWRRQVLRSFGGGWSPARGSLDIGRASAHCCSPGRLSLG